MLAQGSAARRKFFPAFPLDSWARKCFVLLMFLPNTIPVTTAGQPFSGGFPGYLQKNIVSGRAVHELRAPADTAGHVVFAVKLLSELPIKAPILWASPHPSVYPPGLAWAGLDPARCLFAQVKDDAESLATLEVALRGGMAGVGECVDVSRVAARRLALAAKTGGSVGFLLRHAPAFTQADSTAFATRWMISPARSEIPGAPRLRAELLYAKGGQPGVFMVQIRETEHGATPSVVPLVQPGIAAHPQRRAG
jgi:protein ImuA